MKKLFVGSDNTVVLTCPGCDKTRIVDVSRQLATDGQVALTYRFQCDTCKCGHSSCKECIREKCALGHVNTVSLERRKSVRKNVSVTGQFILDKKTTIKVKILDISRKGVRVEFHAPILFNSGTIGVIDFQLDDPNQTRITKEVRMDLVSKKSAVLIFQEGNAFSAADKAIGFYLMNNQ